VKKENQHQKHQSPPTPIAYNNPPHWWHLRYYLKHAPLGWHASMMYLKDAEVGSLQNVLPSFTTLYHLFESISWDQTCWIHPAWTARTSPVCTCKGRRRSSAYPQSPAKTWLVALCLCVSPSGPCSACWKT